MNSDTVLSTLILDFNAEPKNVVNTEAISDVLLDELFGFHDQTVEPDGIEWPEDDLDAEEFGDLLFESFEFDEIGVGEVVTVGELVRCVCIHKEQRTIEVFGDECERVLKFFVVAFQCDVVLVALMGTAIQDESGSLSDFDQELYAFRTYDGDYWQTNSVVNGYLGEMSGDLTAEDDDEFFDD